MYNGNKINNDGINNIQWLSSHSVCDSQQQRHQLSGFLSNSFLPHIHCSPISSKMTMSLSFCKFHSSQRGFMCTSRERMAYLSSVFFLFLKVIVYGMNIYLVFLLLTLHYTFLVGSFLVFLRTSWHLLFSHATQSAINLV